MVAVAHPRTPVELAIGSDDTILAARSHGGQASDALALQRHPLTGDASYLRASSIRLQLEPEKREEILDDTIERLAKKEKVLLTLYE